MMEKKPKYIENVGWRYDVEQSHKRRHRTHKYNDVGTYLITVVVMGRRPVFGSIDGDVKSAPTSHNYPKTILSPLGEKVLNEELPKIHSCYPMVEIWKACIMPDHIHLILRINEMLPQNKYLGQVIGAFGNFLLLRHPEKVQVFFHRRMEDDTSQPLSRLQPPSHSQYPSYHQYPSYPQSLPPCVRHQPNINQRLIPTEQTLFWQKEHKRLMDIVEQGDVLVTPGISECEKRIKNECLLHHYRLIHLQEDPIESYWKPERSRFDACVAGTLLILAPWKEDLQGDSSYERFHNLNALAKDICALGADAAYKIKNTSG